MALRRIAENDGITADFRHIDFAVRRFPHFRAVFFVGLSLVFRDVSGRLERVFRRFQSRPHPVAHVIGNASDIHVKPFLNCYSRAPDSSRFDGSTRFVISYKHLGIFLVVSYNADLHHRNLGCTRHVTATRSEAARNRHQSQQSQEKRTLHAHRVHDPPANSTKT